MLIYMFWFYFLFPKKEWILVVKSINLRVRPEFGSDIHKLWAFYRLSFLICGKWIGFLSQMLWAFRYDNSSSSPGRYLPDFHNTFGFVTIKNIYRHSPVSPLATSPQAEDLWIEIVVQSLNCVRLFETTWTAARHASLSFTISQSLLKLMSIESVMSSNHLILSRPHLLPPSIFPSIRVFSKWVSSSHQVAKVLELQLQYQSFQWIYSGLISFVINGFDLLAVQGTLNSLLQHHSTHVFFSCVARKMKWKKDKKLMVQSGPKSCLFLFLLTLVLVEILGNFKDSIHHQLESGAIYSALGYSQLASLISVRPLIMMAGFENPTDIGFVSFKWHRWGRGGKRSKVCFLNPNIL